MRSDKQSRAELVEALNLDERLWSFGLTTQRKFAQG